LRTHDLSPGLEVVGGNGRVPDRPPRASVLGCKIDRVDMDQALSLVEAMIASRTGGQHMAINAAKLVALQDDTRLREIVRDCEIVTADGQAVVWASRLLGDRLPARVAGIDLMQRLLERAEHNGYRVYILGARPEVLDRAIARIQQTHPGLAVAGYRDGYFEEEEITDVTSKIREASPDILFVAMSSPRKEYFLSEHREELKVPVMMGVGGAVDVIAGLTRRAPLVVQRIGLEWLVRLLQEPRRLIPRYAVTNTRFLFLLAREKASCLFRRKAVGARTGGGGL
jgi:N-acetylglucosaminyldiphosphoundecaprenol N-acetyl-beta-D-mannosaminyltransferase